MMALTQSQADLLEFIRCRIVQQNGVAPTYDEMREYLGLTSKSGVHRLLSALEERGRIRRMAGRARAIEIIEPGLPLASFSIEQLRAEIARRERLS